MPIVNRLKIRRSRRINRRCIARQGQSLDAVKRPQMNEHELLERVRHTAEHVLRPRAHDTDRTGQFPDEQMRALTDLGLNGMAIPVEYGGLDLSPGLQARIFMELAAACVTSAFVLSQQHVCTALLSVSDNVAARQHWLPDLASGTVRGADGINFLRLPADRAPMRAVSNGTGYRLNGLLPWVTASHHSDLLVCGALLEDNRQIVVAMPMDDRVRTPEAAKLMAFEASDTGPVHLDGCDVPDHARILGPDSDVLARAPRLATAFVPAAMALGHMRTSLDAAREGLHSKGISGETILTQTQEQITTLEREILAAVDSQDTHQAAELRARANVLVLRAAHLALIVAGGTGYRRESAAQRYFREAAFWSVWSVGGGVLPATLDVMSHVSG